MCLVFQSLLHRRRVLGPAWFYSAPGSGISINVGRTLVLDFQRALKLLTFAFQDARSSCDEQRRSVWQFASHVVEGESYQQAQRSHGADSVDAGSWVERRNWPPDFPLRDVDRCSSYIINPSPPPAQPITTTQPATPLEKPPPTHSPASKSSTTKSSTLQSASMRYSS